MNEICIDPRLGESSDLVSEEVYKQTSVGCLFALQDMGIDRAKIKKIIVFFTFHSTAKKENEYSPRFTVEFESRKGLNCSYVVDSCSIDDGSPRPTVLAIASHLSSNVRRILNTE